MTLDRASTAHPSPQTAVSAHSTPCPWDTKITESVRRGRDSHVTVTAVGAVGLYYGIYGSRFQRICSIVPIIYLVSGGKKVLTISSEV